jgi:hypothetical protein
MSVGGWLIIWNASGTANGMNGLLTGFFKIVAISGNTVTVKVPFSGNLLSILQQTSGNGTPVTAILNPAINVNGCVIGSAGLGNLSYIGIVTVAIPTTNYVAVGGEFAGPANVDHVGVWGYGNNIDVNGGFIVYAASVTLQYCGSTNNGAGCIAGEAGNINASYCGFSHNTQFGIWCESGGRFGSSPEGSSTHVFIAGTQNGVAVNVANESQLTAGGGYQSGTLNHSTIWLAWNNGPGIACTASRTVSSTPGDTVQSQNNYGNYDLEVSALGVSSVFMGPGGRYINQAQNVLTANGLIQNVS